MNAFIDYSAILAILNASVRFHPLARETWNELLNSETTLFTNNYILLETSALLQLRFGIDALRLFESDLLPVFETYWVDQPIHEQGISTLLSSNRRDLSLVDCTSFEIMRQRELKRSLLSIPILGNKGLIYSPDSFTNTC
jgi:predicted nucleic acid-binding protein